MKASIVVPPKTTTINVRLFHVPAKYMQFSTKNYLPVGFKKLLYCQITVSLSVTSCFYSYFSQPMLREVTLETPPAQPQHSKQDTSTSSFISNFLAERMSVFFFLSINPSLFRAENRALSKCLVTNTRLFHRPQDVMLWGPASMKLKFRHLTGLRVCLRQGVSKHLSSPCSSTQWCSS